MTIAKHDLERMALSRKLGGTVSVAIGAVETRLDTTSLGGDGGYPMTLQITAQSASSYVYQGGATVAVQASPADAIGAGEWREVTVDEAADAYFACIASSSLTGTLVARRIDHVGA